MSAYEIFKNIVRSAVSAREEHIVAVPENIRNVCRYAEHADNSDCANDIVLLHADHAGEHNVQRRKSCEAMRNSGDHVIHTDYGIYRVVVSGEIRTEHSAEDSEDHYKIEGGLLCLALRERGDRNRDELDVTEEQRFRIEKDQLSWEFFKANQFLGEYFFLNPMRLQAQEELYDNLISHGITKVSSFSNLPTSKEDVNFMQRPINWE